MSRRCARCPRQPGDPATSQRVCFGSQHQPTLFLVEVWQTRLFLRGLLACQAASDKRPYLGNSSVVPIDVDDAKPVEQRSLRYQQIWNRCAVPHSMVMGQILLEAKRAVKNVRRGGNDLEAGVQQRLAGIVVGG